MADEPTPRGGPDAPCASPARIPLDAASATERLLAAHEAWFDVQRGYELGGDVFDGFAEMHAHGEKYVLVKSAKLWEIDTGELVFFKALPVLDAATLDATLALVKEAGFALVHPGPNHMSSNVGLVIVADSVEPEARRAVRSTRYRKNYRFGLWGWSDLRLAVVDLSQEGRGRFAVNGAGKSLLPTLEANLGASGSDRGRKEGMQ